MRFFVFMSLLVACDSSVKVDVPDESDFIVEIDADGDGYLETDDCDDQDSAVFPGAIEVCDAIDNNCDGEIDEGVSSSFFLDIDEDGFGNSVEQVEACEAPEGYVPNGNDCDDENVTVFPSASELCDGFDNDCDGDIDEELLTTFYADLDQDGFGDDASILETCELEEGFSSIGGDCDDTDPLLSPDAEEICDGIDNNCDGDIDEISATSIQIWYADADLDGFGDATMSQIECSQPSGYVSDNSDCNDAESTIYPSAPELCDGLRNDCNANSLPADEIDQDNDGISECEGDCDDTNSTYQTNQSWFFDADLDGYGDPNIFLADCLPPAGYIADNTDCDDTNGIYHINQNWFHDSDLDGYGNASVIFNSCIPPTGYVSNTTDCNDSDSTIYPSAPELCDLIDNDCDGNIPVDETDIDGDSFSACAGDCDDQDPTINPNATEICSGLDLNCDQIDPDYCSSCLEIKQVGSDNGDGVYTIDSTADGEIDVYCDMTTDGGGWTLAQRTVWDWLQSSALYTNYATWYYTSIGSPTAGNAYRISGEMWDELNINLDHMLVHTARDNGSSGDCDPLYYIGTNGSLSISPSSTTISGFSANVSFFADSSLDAYDDSACVNSSKGVPWFYSGCCTTCPTYQGGYWSSPHPMAYYLDITPDHYGNTTGNSCPSASAITSSGYEGINAMEYYLR